MLNKRKIYIAAAVVCFGAFLGFTLPPWDMWIGGIIIVIGGSVVWLELLRLCRLPGKQPEKELHIEEPEKESKK